MSVHIGYLHTQKGNWVENDIVVYIEKNPDKVLSVFSQEKITQSSSRTIRGREKEDKGWGEKAVWLEGVEGKVSVIKA